MAGILQQGPDNTNPPNLRYTACEEAEYVSAVRFPFRNGSHSRFSRCQYGDAEMTTTVYESDWHWRRGFLQDTRLDNHEGTRHRTQVHLVHYRAPGETLMVI